MDRQLWNEINTAYSRLESKQTVLIHALSHQIVELESGWYNGHYHMDENGNWFRESCPIPVIDVKGLCDIEIPFDVDGEQIFEFVKMLRREGFYLLKTITFGHLCFPLLLLMALHVMHLFSL